MSSWTANSFRKGQFKIQEMAFVLVALMIFFALVFVLYASLRGSLLHGQVNLQRNEEALAMVHALASSPEFSFSGCPGCVDFDKLFTLSQQSEYSGFWKLQSLKIRVVYPEHPDICTSGNYPDCGELVLLQGKEGTPVGAFVPVCYRAHQGNTGYVRCVIGKIYASSKEVS